MLHKEAWVPRLLGNLVSRSIKRSKFHDHFMIIFQENFLKNTSQIKKTVFDCLFILFVKIYFWAFCLFGNFILSPFLNIGIEITISGEFKWRKQFLVHYLLPLTLTLITLWHDLFVVYRTWQCNGVWRELNLFSNVSKVTPFAWQTLYSHWGYYFASNHNPN